MNYTAPIFFESNRIKRPYKGGMLIDEIQGMPDHDDTNMSEEWLASVDYVDSYNDDAADHEGLSIIRDEKLHDCSLKHLLSMVPRNILGNDYVTAYGVDIGFKCKLVDIAKVPAKKPSAGLCGSSFPAGAFFALATREIDGKNPQIWIKKDSENPELLFGIASKKQEKQYRALSALNAGETIFLPPEIKREFAAGIFMFYTQASGFYEKHPREDTKSSALMDVDADSMLGLIKPWETIVKRSDEGACLQVIGPELTDAFSFKRFEIAGRYQLKLPSPFCLVFCAGGAGRMRWASGSGELVAGQYFFMPYTVPWVELLAYTKMSLLVVEPPSLDRWQKF